MFGSGNREGYTSKQKVEVLREHPENQASAAETAERYGFCLSLVLRWKKQLRAVLRFSPASRDAQQHQTN